MEEIKINPLAEIKSVKIQGNSYLLNGTMSVPTADGNREYELIKLWIKAGNEPVPEFTAEEIVGQEAATAEAKAKAERTATMLEGDTYTIDGTEYR